MSHPSIHAKRLEISGVVQGVGFRPFLYGLAIKHDLLGRVSNTAKGVDLVIQGPEAALDAFIQDIDRKKPLLSQIAAIDVSSHPIEGFSSFNIVKSQGDQRRSTLISADVSICKDCLNEVLDPEDRRYEYPFINCTNCGPRYTIIKDIPYDRPKTSMGEFTMCPVCQAEYDDPLDRRFHAQPNACPDCGPHVFLTDNKGKRQDQGPVHALDLAAELLAKGKIVAIKGLGGFHLAATAYDDTAVSLLRERKKRPDKPFALMAAPDSNLFDHVNMDERERELLFSYHRPIVLLDKKPHTGEGRGLAPSIAPKNNCLGIMLPYTPLHYLLLDKGPDILVMTSGNRSGQPLSIENEDALSAFSHIADYFLFHDRDIYFRADDSIARVQRGFPRFLRRSRGYAPLPIQLQPFLNHALPQVLGLGAGLKSSICLTRENYGFISQHIGDLEHPKVHEFYGHTIEHMQRIMSVEPVMAAHDLHPGYFSTEFAKALGQKGRDLPLLGVQHHHAHALSCMAENHLTEEVIALTLDGTGFGTDGHIWGGEILTCSYGGFKRRAHLKYLPMPGGDAAVLEPWRMAAAMLYKAFGPGFMDLNIPYTAAMDQQKLDFLVQMMDRQVNTPLTSSAGRLFDGTAALLDLCHRISYESQAAMELEACAGDFPAESPYPYDLAEEGDCLVLDLLPSIRAMVRDIQHQIIVKEIAARFHTTVSAGFIKAAVKVRQMTGLDSVVLSGGVFNNNRILNQLADGLESESFSVYTHSQVPCGDGGIALGQAMAAAFEIEKLKD